MGTVNKYIANSYGCEITIIHYFAIHYLCDHKTLGNQLHKSRNGEQLVILAIEQDVLYMITETRNYTQSYTPVGKSSGMVCRMSAI